MTIGQVAFVALCALTAMLVWDLSGTARKSSNQQSDTSKAKDEMNDNWKHRSSQMVCNTCMFFVPKLNVGGEEVELGRCRANAPVVQKGWPVVFKTDWCGQHKLDENMV